ncbi:hypothetical protein [Peptacetobacter hominis]|uniref:hypothetical protein n=1 Tax=Peptacetobacter hominis TaxID=2743610 RepID=UPI00158191BD|nr:hypothetical protein [Peptacetobacter hominis]
MKKYPHKRKGSVCIASLVVLTLITVMCISVHERIKSRYISRNMVVESENILRRAEGVSIVVKARVIEITQSFYDRCSKRGQFKSLIESTAGRNEYIEYIENSEIIPIEGAKIKVQNGEIIQNGSGRYKFIIICSCTNKDVKKDIQVNVDLYNLFKEEEEKEPEEENQKNNNEESATGVNNEEKTDEEIDRIEDAETVEHYNAEDAIVFRIDREY